MAEFDELKPNIPSHKIVAPGIEVVNDALIGIRKTTQDFSDSSAELVKDVTALTDEKVRAQQTIAENDLFIQRQKNLALLEAENTTRKLFEDVGGEELLQQLAVSKNVAIQDILVEQEQLRANEQHETYNPIEWIANFIDQANNESELAEAQRRLIGSHGALLTIAEGNTATSQLLTENAKVRTEGTIIAENENLAADYRMKVADLKINGIKTQAEQVHRAVVAQGTAFNSLIATYKLGQDEEDQRQRQLEHKYNVVVFQNRIKQAVLDTKLKEVQLNQAITNLDVAKATKDSRIDLFNTQARNAQLDFKRSQQELSDGIGFVQIAQAELGMNVEDGTVITSMLRSTNPDMQERYNSLIEHGLVVSQGNVVVSPSQKYKLLSKMNPGGLETQHPVSLIFKEAEAEIERMALGTGKTPKPNEVAAAIDAYVKERFAGYRENIVEDDASNPYIAPPMEDLAAMKEFESTALYQDALKEQKESETKPTKIVAHALAAVDMNVLSLDDAAHGIATMYQSAQAFNSAKNGFPAWGIPTHSTYNASFPVPTLSNTTKLKTIDFADVTAVKLLLVNMLNIKRTKQSHQLEQDTLIDRTEPFGHFFR